MRHDDALAYLRQPGKTDQQVVEILSALASGFDPAGKIVQELDACMELIEEVIEYAKHEEEEAADFYAEIERGRRIAETM